MSKAIRCDRCGEFEVHEGKFMPSQGQWRLERYEHIEWKPVDLCKNCREQLALWYNDKSIVFPKTPILDQVCDYSNLEVKTATKAKEEQKIELDKSPEHISIEELRPMLSSRAYNVISRLQFTTLAEIKREFSLDKLRHIRNVGKQTEAEIVDALSKFNIALPKTDDCVTYDDMCKWFRQRENYKR